MKRPRAAGIMARAGTVPFSGLLGAVLAIPMLAGTVLAQQTSARPDGELPVKAVRQIEALLAAKAQRTPAQRKVSSQLLEAQRTPVPLQHVCRSQRGGRRPDDAAACLGCVRTFLVLLAVLSAALRSGFAASRNPPHPHNGRKRAVFVFAAFLLLTVVNARSQADMQQPNVILILADDMGYEIISSNGGTSYQTPNIDRLARDGMRFTHVYAQPMCTPSRVKLMTGKYNWRNYRRFGRLEQGQYTFAHLMRDAGYATGMTGKWQLWTTKGTLVAPPGTRPPEAGFDEYMHWAYETELSYADKARYDAVRYETFGHLSTKKTSRYWHPAIIRNGQYVHTSPDDYGPDLFSDFALDFIKRHKDEPFFLYYPMVLPHSPWVPTPSDTITNEKKFEKNEKNFAEMVAYADYLVGRLVKTLDDLGIGDETLLLFTGDNGTASRIESRFGQRVIRGGKGTTKDAGTHVPLFARWTGQVPADRVSDDLIEFSDFFVTLSDLTGRPLPEAEVFDGRSFLPQLRGEAGDPRESIFVHYDKDVDGGPQPVVLVAAWTVSPPPPALNFLVVPRRSR